jgi:hypothetical protein
MKRLCVFALLCGVFVFSVYAADDGYGDEPRGDAAMAEKYVAWSETALAQGRWGEALIALEHGADFASVSSDVSYLLAHVRFHVLAQDHFDEYKNVGAVLETIRLAHQSNRWNHYSPDAARFLEAEILTRLRVFSEALRILSTLPPTIATMCLRLTILEQLDEREAFRACLSEALVAHPRDPRPVRILFEYAADRLPEGNERDLMSVALQRLPLLIEADPELAYLAVPFVSDLARSRRLLAAYRASNTPALASIPASLRLGMLSEEQAVDELFAAQALPHKLLLTVWTLLQSDAGRERFRNATTRFSGVIVEDRDEDSFPEVIVSYAQGEITAYARDADQDGSAELIVAFNAGVPVHADFSVQSGDALYPPPPRARLDWEQYPAALAIQFQDARYVPRPFDFFFAPICFTQLFAGERFLYPEYDVLTPALSKRALIAGSAFMERPSREFVGALERIELERGVPQRSLEWLGDRLISETTFHLGRPLMQRVDLDLNGRLETRRRFKPGVAVSPASPLDFETGIELTESDWDGDGVFEYAEQYNTGAARIFWDINQDGTRERLK